MQKELTEKKREGLPMSDKEMEEYLKAFSDIEECIKALYKNKK